MSTTQQQTLPALFARKVAERGDHPAVAMAGESVTYAELERRSAHFARALLQAGAGKGARIALLSADGIFWLTAFLGCMRIGALVSLVSTLCTSRELAHILRTSDTQFLVANRRFLNHDYGEKLGEALPGLANGEAGALRLVDAPYLRAIWLDDAEGMAWAEPVDALLALADSPAAPGDDLLAALEREVAASDDAVIVYTSGSTSAPKAVTHCQRTLACHPPAVAEYFLLKPDDRMMPTLPVFWLGGLVMALEVLSVGGTLVYPQSPSVDDMVEAIATLAVNRVNSWGDMMVKLREGARGRGIDVDSIIGLGEFREASGELIPPPLQANLLGMSETFAVHSAEPLDVRLPADKAGASGRTVNGYQRRIVNPETGEAVATGELGELQLRGGGLMTGFYKRERESVFTADGFYPTGDLCREDADGYLYFVARRGDMIKTRSANVSRLEVEAALREVPGVAIPVVAGIDDPEYGQRVVAAVVPAEGVDLSEESLRDALRELLSSYKVPRNIVFISESDIPRTSTGKIRLAEIGAMIASRISA
ncbi:class I adenylate-forming enzyme family protein [Haliea sp. E17]|uniref:class I adenylate-forming enzyme family protein n=1 Tax=Haliea sp. E17 TaxID=3401576 RepID=UPI003AAB2DB3